MIGRFLWHFYFSLSRLPSIKKKKKKKKQTRAYLHIFLSSLPSVSLFASPTLLYCPSSIPSPKLTIQEEPTHGRFDSTTPEFSLPHAPTRFHHSICCFPRSPDAVPSIFSSWNETCLLIFRFLPSQVVFLCSCCK